MKWMTCIGDLHGRTPPVRPDSYLVLLAGDICPDGGEASQRAFLDGPLRGWLDRLPCPCVAVPGNHDHLMAERPGRIPAGLKWELALSVREVSAAGLRLLCLPLVLGDHKAFGSSEEVFDKVMGGLPIGPPPDVVLCHTPPAGPLSRSTSGDHLGSVALAYHAWRQGIPLVVCGHVHEGRGWYRFGKTYCVNATLGAGCDAGGRPYPAPHPPWGLADNSWRRG